MNIQGWFHLELTGLILQSKELSRVFSSITILKHQFFSAQPCLWSNPHIHTWLLKKPWLWWYGPLLTKFMSLLFNMLSRLVITFLPQSKHLLISWLQSPSAVILEPPKIKSDTVSLIPTYLPWSDGTRCQDLSFLNAEFEDNFFTLLFHFRQEA